MMVPALSAPEQAAQLICQWYEAGLKAVDPRGAVERSCAWDGRTLSIDSREVSIDLEANVVAIAIGKAANEMARGLHNVLGDRIRSGIILTKDGHANQPPAGWAVHEAAHPVPDDRGIEASRSILSVVDSLGPGDVAIVLVSGGGSALLELPKSPLTLQDIQDVTRLLLHVGAPIHHLNAVRSELSEVKGGGLRRAIGRASCLSLILSDVLGNDPAVIASGPTIARPSDPISALNLLGKYGLLDKVPRRVLGHLRAAPDDLYGIDASDDVFSVIGDNDLFIEEIARRATSDGNCAVLPMRLSEGEARHVADRFLDTVDAQPSQVSVVIGGGEATVTVTGDGLGGRNTEFALAAAIRLHESCLPWVVASLASDGQDGSIDAAGAIVDSQTLDRGLEKGLRASEYLDNNDSGGYFERVGGLVKPGPTGTNVNDVYIAVRVGTWADPVSGMM